MMSLSVRTSETAMEPQPMDLTSVLGKLIGFIINVNSLCVEADIILKGKVTRQEIRSDCFDT